MKLSQISILLIYLAFHAILSRTVIEISTGYEIIDIPEGITEISFTIYYNPSDHNYNNTSPFIFIKISQPIEISASAMDETSEFVTYPSDYWITLELAIFEGLGKIPFNLKLRNNNTEPAQFFFIDTSKEINIDLNSFLNWNYDISIYDAENEPAPIIFNIENIEETTSISFNMTAKGEIVGEKNLLYYCLNDNNQCNFEELNSLTFIKGQNYIIKLYSFRYKEDEDTYIYMFLLQ